MVHDRKFARKDVQIIFSKDFKTQKIFLVFFVKGEKLLKKFQHAENNFENSKHAVGKSNEVQREFEKGGESKYEINTNLPLARARCL